MFKRLAFRVLLIATAATILAACANVVPPTGGERDALPPVLLRADPPQQTLHFNRRHIRLDFDEYIKLQSTNNIQFTPALRGKPSFEVRFGTLYIDLGVDSLRDSTTYTINFGDAITDLNEGNKLSGFSYVFSTGDYLDSLRFSGQVKAADKREPMNGLLVALYTADAADSVMYLDKPFYFTKTDKNGEFFFQNLKGGEYKLWIFDDKDNNLKYSRAEPAAFIDALVSPQADSLVPKSYLLVDDKKANRRILERARLDAGSVKIVFSSWPDGLQLKRLGVDSTAGLWHQVADSLFFYYPDVEADSLVLQLAYDERVDTLVFRKSTASPKTSRLSLAKNNQPSVLEPLKLTVGRPLALPLDTAAFVWKVDSVQGVKLPFSYAYEGLELVIMPELEANKRYELFVPRGALRDWLSLEVDSFRFSFSSASLEAFGDLVLEDLDSLPAGITHVELLTEQYEVVESRRYHPGEPVTFKKIRPLSYKIRFYADVNANNRLDLGSIAEHTAPEPVWYVVESAKLRANWEVSLSVKTLRN